MPPARFPPILGSHPGGVKLGSLPGLPGNGKMQAAVRVSSTEKDGAAQAAGRGSSLLEPSVPAPPFLPMGLLPRTKPTCYFSCAISNISYRLPSPQKQTWLWGTLSRGMWVLLQVSTDQQTEMMLQLSSSCTRGQRHTRVRDATRPTRGAQSSSLSLSYTARTKHRPCLPLCVMLKLYITVKWQNIFFRNNFSFLKRPNIKCAMIPWWRGYSK